MSEHGHDAADRQVIATDFDGTLALEEQEDSGFPPAVPEMLERVRHWVDEGKEVWVLTARLTRPDIDREYEIGVIQDWLEQHGLPRLEVTDRKMWFFKEYWDDRAVQVVTNTGHPVDGRDSYG